VLVAGPRVILLDEPTSILAPSEVDSLFDILREIRDQGTAVAIVSHKLRELLAITDRVVVLTRGAVTGEFERVNRSWPVGTESEVLHRMFEIEPVSGAEQLAPRTVAAALDNVAPLLTLRSVATDPAPDRVGLRGIDLDLRPGLVHIVVGVDGQGQVELAETIGGYSDYRGRIELDGISLDHMAAGQRARHGIGLLSGDRLGEAGIGEATVAENLVLKRPRSTRFVRKGVFRRTEVLAFARESIRRWGLDGLDPEAPFGTLSGGSMQRMIAAREIERCPRVLISVNPTHGLDARTVDLLWMRLRALSVTGSTVLAFVNDLDESLERADMLAAMYSGSLSPMKPVAATSRESLAAQMVGG
jgi:simple sugar transport system ATP-binding protein